MTSEYEADTAGPEPTGWGRSTSRGDRRVVG